MAAPRDAERLLAGYAAATAAALSALERGDDDALVAALDARDDLAPQLEAPLAAIRAARADDAGRTAIAARALEVRDSHAELERRLAERRDRLRHALDQLAGVAPGAGYGSLAAAPAHLLEIVR